MIRKTHYFFHFKASPWPLIIRINLISLFISISLFFKYSILLNFFLRITIISLSRIFWWYSYSGELNLEGTDRTNLENRIKFSIILFISSEVLFFFSFFWSYFHFFLSPSMETRLRWPPVYLEMFNFYDIPFLNTIILLRSGITITVRHYYYIKGVYRWAIKFLFLTFLMGALFRFFQFQEYNNSFFSINDSIFGSNFFILTGFHGLHVIIGATFLFIVMFRRNLFSITKLNITRFELSAWYWHFVDVVWIFLYFLIYYINNV